MLLKSNVAHLWIFLLLHHIMFATVLSGVFVYILRCIRRHFPSPQMGFEDALLKGLYKTRKTVLLCSMDLGLDKSGTVPSGGVCHWPVHLIRTLMLHICVCVNGIRLLCAGMNIICLYHYAPKIPQFQPLLWVLSVNLSCVAAQLFYRTCIVSSACEAKAVILYAGDKFSGNQWPPWSDL